MDNLALALELAARVHANQTDKAGEQYILHPLALMNMVQDRVEPHHRYKAMIVAILHDTVEDHPGTPMERMKLESDIFSHFGGEVSSAVDALTHREHETYDEYIERLSGNWLARVVKVADLIHNMDPRRIPADQIVDKDFARWERYRRALIRLERS
jgi:(p)ppGpp synthase/HD superfamily hydrolase